MTAATVYRVIMNILLQIFTENQDIFTLLTFFHEELINHFVKRSLKKKQKGPEKLLSIS